MNTPAPSQTELSRVFKVRPLPGDTVVIEADETERKKLAGRFGLTAIESLRAEIELDAEKSGIRAVGTLNAQLIQPCAISGEDFAVTVAETIDLRFVKESTLPQSQTEDGEIEIDLSSEDSDEIEYSGDTFDLGEAIAQTLGLAIDPYAEGPNADAARKAAGIGDEDAPSGPLAEALAALKKG
ncbi:MAG: DUF177 domain-containing protein [Pseudomonadota bacterium]